jgi:hypothetical protein
MIAQPLRPAQQALLGDKYPHDRSAHWYVIAARIKRKLGRLR